MTELEEQDLNGIVREKAAEVEKAAKRARCLEVVFVTFSAICVAAAAGLSAWNTYRLSTIAQDIEENQRINAEFNEGHAQASYRSAQTLVDLQICVAAAFGKFPNISEEEVVACFQPATPPPPAPNGKE